MSLSRASAPARSNTVSKNFLGSAMRQRIAPEATTGGLLEGQELARRRRVDEQPVVELVDALIGELDAEPRLGDDLDRLAELGDDGVLGRVDREEAHEGDRDASSGGEHNSPYTPWSTPFERDVAQR